MDDKFVRMVEQMRTAQKSYFSTRSPQALEKSKQLEREVDRTIKAYREEEQKRKQPELF